MSAREQGVAAAGGGRGPDRGGLPAGLRVGGAFLGVALVALLLLVLDVFGRGVGAPFEFTPRVLTILLAGALLGAFATTRRDEPGSRAKVSALIVAVLLVVASRVMPPEPAYATAQHWVLGLVVVAGVCAWLIRRSFAA
ncbi:hypothetical protein [Corynebacterium frankenforstense]